jgi:hypothetical protein
VGGRGILGFLGMGIRDWKVLVLFFLFREGKGERGEWKEKGGERRRNADCDSGYRIRI